MIPAKKRGRKTMRPTEEELAKLYETMTAAEIGESLGVAENTVRAWLYEYRREARTHDIDR